MRVHRDPSRAPRVEAGFTLIELMIAVAIIAILSQIALPAYSTYVTRGKLTDAFNTLTSFSLSMGQSYQDNRSYVPGCATMPAANNFTYTCTPTATSYLLTATGATSATTGFAYTLTDAGVRATTAAPSGWPTNATCWVNSKSGSCQ